MKRFLGLCILLVVAAGCAETGARHVRYPNAVTPELQVQFNAAQERYLQKDYDSAAAALIAFVERAPYTELTDNARFLVGEIASLRKEYQNAVAWYRAAYAEIASPRIEPKARFKAAMALARMGQHADALAELGGVRRGDASASLRLRIDSLGFQEAAAAGQPQKQAILWSLWLLDDAAEGAPAEKAGPDERIVPEAEAHAKVKHWIDDKSVTREEVDELPLRQMRGKRSGGYALYKLALISNAAGDRDETVKLLRGFVSTYPKHELYAAARLLLGELGGAVGEGAGIAIGVILPLSGRFAVYGESVLHGIECAVGVREPCVGPSGVRLVVRDSESFAGGAPGAVEDIAQDKEVVAIVGPLQSTGALEAAQKAQELGIPLISLSQRDGVAEVGDSTFRNSISTSSEMATLAADAIERQKLKRFFILYPNSRKGQEYRRLFAQEVAARGGKVVATKSYSQSQVQPVNELRGRGAAEFGQQQQESGGPSVDTSVSASYDAIFIPDAAWVANALLQNMALSGGSRARLLGIARWNDPEQARRRAEYLEGATFVDSFFKGASDEEVSAFVVRFRQAYNTEPTLLEALGYDTARIVLAAALEKGSRKRESMKAAIAKTSDFPGVAGRTSFDEQGDARRQLWMLTIRGGEIRSAN